MMMMIDCDKSCIVKYMFEHQFKQRPDNNKESHSGLIHKLYN